MWIRRQRVELQTKPQACQGCHIMINPLGFSLEHFDAVGRFRETENGKPIDASGTYDLASGETRSLNGAADLATFLADNSETHRAFAMQLFHHMAKQSVMAYGPQTPEQLRDNFAEQGFSIRDLMVQIATRIALGPDKAASQAKR